MENALIFERDEKVYLVGPVVPIQPKENELEEFAFADVIRQQSPNEMLLWLRGQYVEADLPNLNGQMWSSEELAIKSVTPRLMPVSVMHNPQQTVGLIADTRLLSPDADKVPRARIDTALALWKHRYPDVCEEAMHNYDRGTLMQSMECLPLDTEILTRRGWRRYDELRASDETVGYNPSTGCNEWTAIHQIVRKRSPVVSLGNAKWRVSCTEGHRWLAAYGRRVGSKFVYADRRMVETRDLGHRDQLILSARAALDHPDGHLQVTPAEAALIGWIVGDGTYRAKGSSFSISIYQSKPDGVMALEMALAEAGMDYAFSVSEPTSSRRADGVAIKQRFAMHRYKLPAARARDLWYRAELDHLSWTGFVLRLADDARAAWLEAIYQAEGNENHGSRCISQQPGPVKDAIALAGYLEGYRPVSHEYGDDADNAQAASHVRLARRPVNGAPLTMIHLGEQEVWCPVTGLGTWTMRQGGQILLTGNCLPGYYDCLECGHSVVKLPGGAERANWCAHLKAGAVDTAAAITRAPRRLGDVTFTGTGLIFGSRGARGANDKGYLETFREEVAEFYERARTDKPIRRHRRMETIEIPRSEYDELKLNGQRMTELTARQAGLEETAAKVPALEAQIEKLEVEKKTATDELAAATTKIGAFEESARAATLSGERLGKLGDGFRAKLPDTIKAKLEEQAKSMSDEDWTGRLEELAQLLGVKPDEGAPAGAAEPAPTFSREETARAGGAVAPQPSQTPSRTAVSTVLGGLLETNRPRQPEPAKK